MTDHASRARAIIDRGAYMTLATADIEGRPWPTPVWYAPESYVSLLWISAVNTRHSRNLELRPELGIVIFDSAASFGSGDAVFFEATAAPVPDVELEHTLAVFSEAMLRRAGKSFDRADLSRRGEGRLYRAIVRAAFVAVGDNRLPVDFS